MITQGGRYVTADGNWNLVVSTPMGERRATLSLKAGGDTLAGTQMADGNIAEIFDGTVNGNQLSWKVSISDPMPLTLEFNGTVEGDEVTGSVILGNFGSSSFSGTRS
jgi:hypothetical protein